jgi:hypothetical protein
LHKTHLTVVTIGNLLTIIIQFSIIYVPHLQLQGQLQTQHNVDTDNNNSVQFFIIYVLSQQLLGQLQTQHSVNTGNYIMDKHNIK